METLGIYLQSPQPVATCGWTILRGFETLKEIQKSKKKKRVTVIRLSAAHKHMSKICKQNWGREREREKRRGREVLPEAVAGNNGKLSDREAFNGALTALCW